MSAVMTALSRRSIILFALCASLIVTGCAYGPTPYQASASDRGFGYREQQIESNRFRITFAGNSATSRETVENYLLYRAAEVTIENGFDYFVVERQDTQATERAIAIYDGFYHPGLHYSIHGGFRRGYWHRGRYYHTDTYQVVTRYEASAIVTVHEGDKPEDNESAYNAREVLEYLGPIIRRPEDSPRRSKQPRRSSFHK